MVILGANEIYPYAIYVNLENHKTTEIFKIKEWKKICQAHANQNKQYQLH